MKLLLVSDRKLLSVSDRKLLSVSYLNQLKPQKQGREMSPEQVFSGNHNITLMSSVFISNFSN